LRRNLAEPKWIGTSSLDLKWKNHLGRVVKKFSPRTISTVMFFVGLAGSIHGQVLAPIAISFGTDPDTGLSEGQNSIGLPAENDPNAKTPIIDSQGDPYHLFLVGEDPDDGTAGLPTDGTISSMSTTTTFQLAPYTGPNVLVSDGTLVLATPASYSNLGFLINSVTPTRGVTDPANFTLHFIDGSSTMLTTQEDAPYWTGAGPGVAGGSVALSTPALEEDGVGFSGADVNFDEYDFVLSSADAAKTLVSIDVDASGGELITYAVSGMLSASDPPGDPPDDPQDDPLPVPEPPIWSLVGLILAGAFLVRRTRLILMRGAPST
jgi:hypothetical protein